MPVAMPPTSPDALITENAAIPTWFGIGGRADRFAAPASAAALRRCLEIDPALRVLGEGANLLVDDDGVPGLVVALTAPAFTGAEFDDDGVVRVGAGADLPRLVVESVRRGLAGLEGLGGIPATIGGALVMNAGGAFGQIADAVARVHAVDRAGRDVTLERADIPFGYRAGGLRDLVVTGAELRLTPADPAALRARLKDVMAYKKASQPMADNSAGCCFKNPTLAADLEGVAGAGTRVSAGLLIDRAGLKGVAVGGARVSERHGNFVVTAPGAKARHVIDLMALIVRAVHDRFGVTLHPEVVIWSRHP